MAAVARRRYAQVGSMPRASRAPASPWRLVVTVLLPFAAGFHLSHLLRTINALIADELGAELGIGAAELGLLTATYFLAFGAAQIPCGILLDRHGPKLVQSVLFLIASAGALVFAVADNLVLLMVGRALIGLGVAAALLAGLKAIVLWFPPDRQALLNGWIMMLGALGAVSATAPAEALVAAVGWRGLFATMSGLSAMTALLILLLVPDRQMSSVPARSGPTITVWTILHDQRFWRIAPLSALGIGTSWALQGLWAAPWLRDVDDLERTAVVGHLATMAVVLSVSGLALGVAADRLRRIGVRTETILAATFALSLVGQTALVLDWPVPAILPWSLIAVAVVATVLGYTVLGEIFPRHASGRANGALNLLQVGAAFAVQSVFGAIVALWQSDAGRYPPEAYRTALVFFIGLQLVALGWFMTARAGMKAQREKPIGMVPPAGPVIAYREAAVVWIGQTARARRQVARWRTTAVSMVVLLSLLGLAAVPHDSLGSISDRALAGGAAPNRLLQR